MKYLIPTFSVAVVVASAPAEVITTVRDYPANLAPTNPPSPPYHLIRGDDGTLYGVGDNLCRWEPDGSGFTVLRGGFGAPPSLFEGTLYCMGDNFDVWKVNTDGSGFTVFGQGILAGNLARQEQISQTYISAPGLKLFGNTLYGWGFKINIDGTGYSELAGFPAWDELADWYLAFDVSDGNYFGSTSRGGLHGAGTVFRLNLDGSPGYTVDVAPGDNLDVGGWPLKAVGDTVYGFGFPDRMFKVNADGSGYSVLRNESFPNVNFPTGRLWYFDGAFYWVSYTYPNDRFTVDFCRMNLDGTGLSVLKSWSNNPASSFSVQMLTVAEDGIYGVGSSNLEGVEGLKEEGGFLFRMNTDGSDLVVLHEFVKPNSNPHPDGFSPQFLTASDGVLYGLDFSPERDRRLFRMNADGTDFTTLKLAGLFNSDPFYPISRPTVSGSNIIGVGEGRGMLQEEPYDASQGVVYRMNTDGNGYTVLKEFTVLADGGEAPTGALELSGSALYGTIPSNGGDGSHSGRIFTLNTDGSGYRVLRTFGPTAMDPATGQPTNSEGLNIEELTAVGSTLYGAARDGGQFGYGTVVTMQTDGTGFAVLRHFTPETPNPVGRLTLSDDTLYGLSAPMSEQSGGKVFRINTDGTGFMVVKHFPEALWDDDLQDYTNTDGVNPIGGVALWGNTLYGTTSHGGRFGMGTLFKVHTDGTGFTVVQHLEGGGPGTFSGSGLRDLVLSGCTLYGPSESGGSHGCGAIYSINLLPALSIAQAGAGSVEVSWPTVPANVILQNSTGGPGPWDWADLTDPIQIDGTTSTARFPISPGSRFFRLIHR